jgi:chromosome segregation ATPase
MNAERLIDELDGVLKHIQAEVHSDLTGTRKATEELRVERAAQATALAQIEDQHKHAAANLSMVMADVERLSVHVGVGSNIAKAKAELEKLRAEVEKADLRLAGLLKQQTEEETKLVALRNETQRLIAVRTEGEAVMANLRAQVRSLPI